MLVGWIAKSKNPKVASVRYRCHTPIRTLTGRGFPVEIYQPAKRNRYSLVIFSKVYSPREQQLAWELKQAGVRTALDLCDNHFFNPYDLPAYRDAGHNLRSMLGLVDSCICSTPTLKDEVLKSVSTAPHIYVVGDAVEELPPLRKRWLPSIRKKRPTLLWQGIHGVPNAECGMLDILKIKEPLTRLARDHDFELLVLSNNKAKYKSHIAPLPFRTRYCEWSLPRLRRLIDEVAGVIIPVTPNPFTLCKSNNRLTLPLGYGVPVVADSIPSYAEFAPYVSLDQWDEGLRAILERRPVVAEKTASGRRYVMANYSAEKLGEQWERALSAALTGEAV